MAPGHQFTHHLHHPLQTSALPVPMRQLEAILGREQLAAHIRPRPDRDCLEKRWGNGLYPLLDRHYTLSLMLPHRLWSWDVRSESRTRFPFEIQEKILVGIASAVHQDDIALNPQAPYPRDPPRHIEHLKKGRIILRSRKAAHEHFDLGAILVGDWQSALPIQAQAPLLPLTFRTAIKKDSAAALPQLPQQVFDHAAGSRTFHPPRRAIRQRGRVGLEKDGAQGQRQTRRDLQGMGADQHTREEACHIPRTWREPGFIKIVQVKIRQTIVAFIAPEVFKM